MNAIIKNLIKTFICSMFAALLVSCVTTNSPTDGNQGRSQTPSPFNGPACASIAKVLVRDSSFTHGGPKDAKPFDDGDPRHGSKATDTHTLCKVSFKSPISPYTGYPSDEYEEKLSWRNVIASAREKTAWSARIYCTKMGGRAYLGSFPNNAGKDQYPLLCTRDNEVVFVLTEVNPVSESLPTFRWSAAFYFSIVEPINSASVATPAFEALLAQTGFQSSEHYTNPSAIAKDEERTHQLEMQERYAQLKQQKVQIEKVSQIGARVCSTNGSGFVEGVAPSGKIQIRAQVLSGVANNVYQTLAPTLTVREQIIWDDPRNWRLCES